MVCLKGKQKGNSLKGKQCEGSTPLKESHNNHFKLKACTLHAQVHVQENSAKFLVMLQAEEVQ